MAHTPSRKNASNERTRDRGHFNQYGMRDDARTEPVGDRENAADGLSSQRFGAGGDLSTYANRVASGAAGELPSPAPASAVNAEGSARALGLDHGGEGHRDQPLSSRQGSAVFGERADRKR